MTLSFKRPTEAGDVIVDAGAAADDYVERPHLLRLLLAWAYLDAAEIVAAQRPKDELDYIEVVGMQLLAQALEITLKAYLSWSGFPEQELEGFRHDLAALTKTCGKWMLDTRPIGPIVDRISEPYKQHWYRYPTPGEVPLVDLRTAIPLCRQTWRVVETLGTQGGNIEIYSTGRPPLSPSEQRRGIKTRPDLSKPLRRDDVPS